MSLSEDVESFSLVLMGIIILVIMYAMIGSFFEHRHIHLIHETGVGIIIGFIFGLIMYFLHDVNQYEFNEELFFYALLPPMIFSGGYNLQKRKFFKNFVYIALFGVGATFVCFGIVFALTYLINELHYIRKWGNFNDYVVLSTPLIVKFSATICASDAVAALTIIKSDKYPKLFAIVFGEGLMNDAVAIILFQVVDKIFKDDASIVSGVASALGEESTVSIVFGILGGFILNVVCSLAIGVACGLLCSKIFQKMRFLTHNPVLEVVILFLFGLLSYVVAEVVGMSGVITVLICGLVLAHFNFYNLSVTGQLSTGVTFQTISFVAEAFVFVYLGLSTMFYAKESEFSFTFVVLELVIVVFARFVALFGLSLLVKLCYKSWNVTWWELLIVTVAGVIRGSVAFALILTIKETNENKITVNIVKSSVLLLVFITTIFLGAIMPAFITACLNQDKKNSKGSFKKTLMEDEKEDEEEDAEKEKPRPFFKMVDEEYLKPFFIFNYRYRKEEIKEFKKMLKMNSPEFKGGEFVAIMKTNARMTIVNDEQEEKMQKNKSIFTSDHM